MVVAEIPRLPAHVLGRRAEDSALDRHPSMRGVVVTGRKKAFDGDAEEDDPPLLTVEMPARHLAVGVVRRQRTDLEPDVLELRPRPAEELDRGADGEIEAIDAPIQRGERRLDDLAAPEAAVSAVPGTAASGGGGDGTATGHVEKSRRSGRFRRGTAAAVGWSRTLTGMDGRLCSKVGCAREAVATLTYDYGDQMAALGPLGAANDPQAHDLCAPHADRLSVPAGWLVVRHEALRA